MPVDVEQLLIAEGAVFVLPAQIAVLLANGEERGDGEVRHGKRVSTLRTMSRQASGELMASFMYMWKTVPPV